MISNILKKIFIVVALLLIVWVIVTSPPFHFKEGVIVSVTKGQSIKEIAHEFKEHGVIQSEFIFTNLIILFNLDSKVVSGDYVFDHKIDVLEVIKRISTGDYNIQAKRITLIEGLTAREMSYIFADLFYTISADEFFEHAIKYEGYLFPDTYYFPENVTTEEVIQKMRLTFDEKISENSNILDSEYVLRDIVTMASIVEKEATSDSMSLVAGILWNRIQYGIPLQVDAGFVYERGKHTFELSLEDLQTDSTYNTYTRRGLPPTPISNPGLQALQASAFPTETDYFYFLTGYDGNMYYAETLSEHDENKEKYLREQFEEE